MTVPDEAIGKLIADNHVGGVILFANNLKDKQQINTLTAWYAAMKTHAGIRLFIGTDNEGGNRLAAARRLCLIPRQYGAGGGD